MKCVRAVGFGDQIRDACLIEIVLYAISKISNNCT